MAENFLNLKKETDIQVQEAQSFPNKMKPNTPTPRHIIIKIAKVKYREFQRQQEDKQSYTREPPHKAINDFLCRNFAGQKGVTYIQRAERENPAT